MYKVEDDLYNYLAGLTDPVNDDLIGTPIESNKIFTSGYVDFSSINDEQITEQLVITPSTGLPNPKWQHDQWFISFMTIGRDKTYYENCQTLLNTVVDEFLGKAKTKIGDRLYVHATFSELPRFIGFRDDTMPVFSATMNVYVQGLVNEFNRYALC